MDKDIKIENAFLRLPTDPMPFGYFECSFPEVKTLAELEEIRKLIIKRFMESRNANNG